MALLVLTGPRGSEVARRGGKIATLFRGAARFLAKEVVLHVRRQRLIMTAGTRRRPYSAVFEDFRGFLTERDGHVLLRLLLHARLLGCLEFLGRSARLLLVGLDSKRFDLGR